MNEEHVSLAFSNSKDSLKKYDGVIITRRLLPYRIFFLDDIPKEFAVHKSIEIIYVLNGNLFVKQNTSKGVHKKNFKAGELCVVSPNKSHDFEAGVEGSNFLAFQMDPYYAEEILGVDDDAEWAPFIDSKEINESILNILKLMYLDFQNPNPDRFSSHRKSKKLIDILNTYFLIDNIDENYLEKSNMTDVESIVISIVEEISKENNYGDISLEDLANEYSVSYSYLSRVFKSVTGYNVTAYIRRERIQRAVDYLLNTDETVSRISDLSGFADTKALNRDLIKLLKMSPTAFKKKYLEDARETEYKNEIIESFVKDIEENRFKLENEVMGKKKRETVIEIDLGKIKKKNMANVLGDFNLRNLIINVDFFDGDFYISTGKIYREKLSDDLLDRLMEAVYTSDLSPIISLDIMSNIEEEASTGFIKYQEYILKKIEDTIEYVAMYIGVSKLRHWKFELNFKNLSRVEIDRFDIYSLNAAIVAIFEKKFGSELKNLGMDFGEISLMDVNEEKLSLLEHPELKRMYKKINYSRFSLSIDEKIEERELKNKIESALDLIDSIFLEDELKVYYELNQVLSGIRLAKEYKLIYYNLLLGLLFLDFEGSERIYGYNIYNKYDNKLELYNLYEEQEIKGIVYYLLNFISQLGSYIVSVGSNHILTKEGEDYVMILHSGIDNMIDYLEDIERYNLYNNLEEMDYIIRGLEGKYKIVELRLGSENSFFYESFTEAFGLERLTMDERQYVESKSMPEMKIYFKGEEEEDYKTSYSLMGIKLIKFKRI